MERLEMEETGYSERRRQLTSNKGGGGPCGNRCVVLKRYSLPICLVEALAILFFVYLLVSTPPNRQHTPADHLNYPNQVTNQTTISTRTFTFDSGDSSKSGSEAGGGFLLLDRIEGCDRRRHDLTLGVACKSSQAEQCAQVETNSGLYANPNGADSARETIIVATTRTGQRLSRQTVQLRPINCGTTASEVDSAAGGECRFKTRLEVYADKGSSSIIGWGGALSDSTINNILALTTNGTRRLLDDYFGRDGLMFNMVRITIGGSDFSSRFYTNDDTARQDDFNLNQFKLREEDILYKIPLLKLIQRDYGDPMWSSEGGMKLFASMWSPPTWMKTNNHFNKGQLRGSIDDEPVQPMGSRPQADRDERYYHALAELKSRFLQAYQNESIRFWGLTVMNEPLFSIQPFLTFNTMIFPRDDYVNYVVKYLGPKIKNNPKLRHIKLMAHDDNRRYLPTYTWPMLDQTRVHQFIDGVSVHGYIDEEYHLIGQTYARYKYNLTSGARPDDNFFVLPTELCSGHLPFMAKALVGNWHRGVHYALDIIRSLQNDAAGWVDWNMALDLEGGPGWLGGRLDAPVIVDKGQDLYYKSPMFYALGQFSRYIPPGSIRLASDMHNAHYDHHFETVTYRLPASANGSQAAKLATVILNNNPYPVSLHLKVMQGNGGAGGRYRERAKSGNTNGSGPYYLVECPADSIITVLYPSDL